jgi:rhamnosyltransferase subunit B
MQILIVAIGSAGDVHPLLAVGRELAGRGNQVTVFTNPVFQPIVERCGLGFSALGTAEEYHRAINTPALWDASTSFATLWQSVSSVLRPMVEDLLVKIDDETVLVGSLWAFGARIVNEMYGVPLVTAQVSASTLLSAQLPPVHKRLQIPAGLPYGVKSGLLWLIERAVLDRVCAPALNELRHELGLPPVSRVLGRWMHSPHRTLGFFPEWFAPPQHDWPQCVTLTGFPLFDEPALHLPDPELEDFLISGPPPIVFTKGSTSVNGQLYMDTALKALKRIGRRGLFLGGHPEQMPQASGILHRGFVSLGTVLPRSAAMVHHGGIGTMSFAFAAGIPQLATPFAHDQFDNAARLERVGCGVRRDWPVDSSSMASTLRQLLESAKVRNACEIVSQRMEPAHVARANAARLIEECGGVSTKSRVPVLSRVDITI